jgi:hypothetical protein
VKSPILTLLLLTILVVPGLAQFKTSVNATGKHKSVMGQPRQTQSQIKARKQQLENYRTYLEIKAQYNHAFDSAKTVYLDSIYVQRKYPATYKNDEKWTALPDSMRYPFRPTPDSVWVSQQVLASGNFPPEAARYLTNPPRKPSVAQVKAQIQDYRNYLEIRKLYEEKYDSAKGVYLDSIYTEKQVDRSYKRGGDWSRVPAHLQYPYGEPDSLTVSRRVLASGDFPPEAAYYLTNPPPNPREMLLDKMDTSAYGKKQMDAFGQQLAGDAMGNDAGNPFGQGANNPNMLSQAQAQAQMALTDPEAFAKQQAQNRLMKKKYSAMPDQRNPDEGTKRNSLEKTPMRNRIYLGGNLSLMSTDPLIMDFNIQVGYWLNRKWLAGVGLSMREQFSGEPTSIAGDSWGHNYFMRYNLPKEFYAWGELQRQVNRSLFGEEKDLLQPVQWQQAYLLGVGREFRAGFARLNMTLLYDFNWRNNDLYPSPFNVRLGVNITGKPK